ncbi:DUF4105 domain-containing protein [Cognatilysobacter lacus]|uniref:DUF7844 domain-containing protein n=1 Tax=Cognatilysobacter lacus TaxID=1643323 RepID=UPI001F4122D9|nr:DUF4105 domain-containing protein [Lysobacter lacus]
MPALLAALSCSAQAGDPAQSGDLRTLVTAARATLPPAVAAMLDGRLRIELSSHLRDGVDGHFRPGVITLRQDRLDDWRQTRQDPADPAARPALAALVHEVAHAWDRSPGGGASRDPRLLDLAGWSATPLHGRLRVNPFRDRSPDPYELDSPAEFLAVNLEHFALDADYACRRPALFAYLAMRTGARATTRDCGAPVFARPATEGAADASPLLAIDPARVYAIDYLLAEPDEHPMSRWGHAMLRIVICAPGHAPGPECRLDLAWHQVLSFRAFVDDVQISSWRGLTGGYPTRLFVLPLPQVVDEYTKVELRTLRSVPLRLSADEIESLLARATQVHWSYDGRYRFIDNNCAVDTWRLLHDGVPRLAAQDLASLSPTGLLRRLSRAGIADTSTPRDPAEARRLGYVFDSIGEHLQTMLSTARESLPIRQARVVDWLDLPPDARGAWIDRADLRSTAALLVLENAALRRQQSRAVDALKRSLGSGSLVTQPLNDTFRDTLVIAERLSRPASLLPAGGYGIPDATERAVAAQRLAEASAHWQAGTGALQALGETALPARQRIALEATRRNIARLGDRLRQLAAAKSTD